MTTPTTEPPVSESKIRYDLWVIGISIAFVLTTLIVANNAEWQFSWKPDGINKLLASAGAIFVVALAIERYMKVFLVDSKEAEVVALRAMLSGKETRLLASNQEAFKHKLNSEKVAPELVSEMWQTQKEIFDVQMEINKILVTRKERLRLVSFVLGCGVALVGLPLLEDIVSVAGEDAWIAQRIVKCTDVILIGALISGGSAAITTFFDAIKARLQSKP